MLKCPKNATNTNRPGPNQNRCPRKNVPPNQAQPIRFAAKAAAPVLCFRASKGLQVEAVFGDSPGVEMN